MSTPSIEQAVLLNNIAVYHLQYGDIRSAQQSLSEAIRITKDKTRSLLYHQPMLGGDRSSSEAKAPAPLPTKEERIHTSVPIPDFHDPHFFLCEHGMTIGTETFHALRPTWTGERQPVPTATQETVRIHEELIEHPSFVTACSAIILFNAAIACHCQGLQEANESRRQHLLLHTKQLYQMCRSILAESISLGSFHATTLAIGVAATNNLSQIHQYLGEFEQASQCLREVGTVVDHQSNRSQMDSHIVRGLILNLMAKDAAAAAA
jgi:hypothetical protein